MPKVIRTYELSAGFIKGGIILPVDHEIIQFIRRQYIVKNEVKKEVICAICVVDDDCDDKIEVPFTIIPDGYPLDFEEEESHYRGSVQIKNSIMHIFEH